MNIHRPRALIGALTLSLFCSAPLLTFRADAQSAEGVEELTRGPVHEAFATSVSYEPVAGIIVDKQPPELIEELAPEQRPAGTNVAWISGYWAWDDDRNDFIWVSGIWRNLPPGRQWVPGYWAAADSRWQWTSGYWEDEENEEVTYLPAPPKALENGPNVNAPSDNHIWISGNWIYNQNRYAWRPGYWEPAQENWVWVPAHYLWTRRGYVYVEGYWDYDVDRRGMVFAPVHFDRVVYSRPDYHYTPSTVIVVNVFLHHLFVRPNYCHYYFGDYYEPRYRDRGWFASFNYHNSRRGYDPFFAHQRWEHRGDRDWERRRRDDFDFYRDNASARPPHTWAALMKRPEDERRGRRDDFDMALPFSRAVANRSEKGQRFQTLDKDAREQLVSQRQEMRKFGRDREQREIRRDGRPGSDGKSAKVLRDKITRSPVVGKRAGELTGNDAPPPRRVGRGDGKDQRRPGGDRGDKRPDGQPGRDRDGDAKPGTAVMPDRRDGPNRGDKRPDGQPGRDRDGDSKPGPAVMPERKDGPDRGDKRPDGQREPQPGRERDEDSKPGPAVMPDRRDGPQRGNDRNDEKRPGREAPSPDRKPTPSIPTMPDRKEAEDRKPQVIPPPQREVERQRPVPAPDVRRKIERKVLPQPQRRPEPERGGTRPTPQPEQRRAIPQPPQRKVEPQPQRRAEPQPRQQRKAEPSQRPQVQQRKAEARPQRPAVQAPRTVERAPQRAAPQQARPAPQSARPQGGGGGGNRKEGRGKRD